MAKAASQKSLDRWTKQKWRTPSGKKSKDTTVKQMLTSDECIQGKDFISLLDSLEDVWHRHEGKNVKVEVTFEPYKE